MTAQAEVAVGYALFQRVFDYDFERGFGTLLCALAWEADDDGSRCAPGIQRLADMSGHPVRGVQRRLSRLRAMGVLEVVAHGEGGRGCPTEYHLRLDRMPLRPSFEEWRAQQKPPRKPLPIALRAAVIARDGHVCQLCQGDVDLADLQIDHIRPVSRGGEDALDNLQVAHKRCNSVKGAKWPG